jgi:hypothetical protein
MLFTGIKIGKTAKINGIDLPDKPKLSVPDMPLLKPRFL